MQEWFWTHIARYTEARWWFGLPALAAFALAGMLLLVAAFRLHQRSTLNGALTAVALGAAVALLAPGLLVALHPAQALGLAGRDPAALPTATWPAAAQVLDQTMQMGYLGAAALLLGVLAMSAPGSRRTTPCPGCGRERHPSWRGECPECRLLEPGAAEAPLMRLGDLSASGVPVTQFGAPPAAPPAQTVVLDSEVVEHAWVEVVREPGAPPERVAIGARLSIGRDPAHCRLVLDDEAVSARHAYIERDGPALVVYDWGSRNGVRVNGELVARRALREGDTLQIGRTALRVVLAAADADAAPTVLLDVAAGHARLVAIDGPIDGEVYPITRIDARIGRSRQNDIVLDAPTVSRTHASIKFDGDGYYLVDAGSPNGTWLDGARVIGSVRLRPGQVIRLGDQQLRFEQEEDCHATES